MPFTNTRIPPNEVNGIPSYEVFGAVKFTFAFKLAEASGVIVTLVTLLGDLASGAASTEISST